jgi:hypothetical protein
MQAAFFDRDRLRAALDEALGKCASFLVARQLAEDERSVLQQQLAQHLQARKGEREAPL